MAGQLIHFVFLISFLQNELGSKTTAQIPIDHPGMSMDRPMPCSSVGSHDEMLRNLGQAVIVPLKSGLQSFNEVSETLLSVGADVILPDTQTFQDLRRHIVSMKEEMERSEMIAADALENLDRETEDLTAEQGRLAKEKAEKQLEINNLQQQLDSDASTLQSYRNALYTQRRNLEDAEDTLNRMRKKRDEAEMVRDIGIGLLAIPIIGWIAGTSMIIVGSEDFNQASGAVDIARREVDNCEFYIRSYSNKVSEIQSMIYNARQKVRDADYMLQQTQDDLCALSGRRVLVADVQNKMRRVVNQLGLLCGVGSVAELQTRRLVLLEPVMKVMEEMTPVLVRITGEELLNTEGINSLMGRMKTNHEKIKQLADAKQNADDKYY